MANIFGILTTLVLIVTIIVGFKNKKLYETEIQNVKDEQASLAISQKRLDDANAVNAELTEEIPLVEARTAELQAATEAQRSENTATEQKIQTRNSDIERNRGRISDLQQKVGSFGNVDQLLANLNSLISELRTLEDEVEGVPGLQARHEQLLATAAQVESENNRFQAVLEGYTRGESRPGMSTRIRSIYPNWGFVTLASGGISGVAGNSTMDVIRNNQVIAKLQVTAVEPNSATAAIVPGTIAEDVTLAVGDTVVPGIRVEPK